MNEVTPHAVRLLVSGSRTCFRRPEFTSDLITYDVMPPTVGRQLLKTVLGADGWTLDRITVCRPVRFGWDALTTARGEKRAMILIDVAYLLEASNSSTTPALVASEGRPEVYLGLSNYPASTRWLGATEQVETGAIPPGRLDLGWMIYDTRSANSRFFRAVMTDGVIDVSRSERLLLAG